METGVHAPRRRQLPGAEAGTFAGFSAVSLGALFAVRFSLSRLLFVGGEDLSRFPAADRAS